MNLGPHTLSRPCRFTLKSRTGRYLNDLTVAAAMTPARILIHSRSERTAEVFPNGVVVYLPAHGPSRSVLMIP